MWRAGIRFKSSLLVIRYCLNLDPADYGLSAGSGYVEPTQPQQSSDRWALWHSPTTPRNHNVWNLILSAHLLFVNNVSALLHPADKNCVTKCRQCILENVITIVILYHIYCDQQQQFFSFQKQSCDHFLQQENETCFEGKWNQLESKSGKVRYIWTCQALKLINKFWSNKVSKNYQFKHRMSGARVVSFCIRDCETDHCKVSLIVAS